MALAFELLIFLKFAVSDYKIFEPKDLSILNIFGVLDLWIFGPLDLGLHFFRPSAKMSLQRPLWNYLFTKPIQSLEMLVALGNLCQFCTWTNGTFFSTFRQNSFILVLCFDIWAQMANVKGGMIMCMYAVVADKQRYTCFACFPLLSLSPSANLNMNPWYEGNPAILFGKFHPFFVWLPQFFWGKALLEL